MKTIHVYALHNYRSTTWYTVVRLSFCHDEPLKFHAQQIVASRRKIYVVGILVRAALFTVIHGSSVGMAANVLFISKPD
jgi:hypothetical protein